ncbi:hypothetical protein Tsubulata_016299, partial [Turnera subulata]
MVLSESKNVMVDEVMDAVSEPKKLRLGVANRVDNDGGGVQAKGYVFGDEAIIEEDKVDEGNIFDVEREEEVTVEGDALADESVVSGQDENHDEHVPSQHADSKQTLISASADAKASSNILVEVAKSRYATYLLLRCSRVGSLNVDTRVAASISSSQVDVSKVNASSKIKIQVNAFFSGSIQKAGDHMINDCGTLTNTGVFELFAAAKDFETQFYFAVRKQLISSRNNKLDNEVGPQEDFVGYEVVFLLKESPVPVAQKGLIPANDDGGLEKRIMTLQNYLFDPGGRNAIDKRSCKIMLAIYLSPLHSAVVF